MSIEQQEQRERDLRLMKNLGFNMQMNIPYPSSRDRPNHKEVVQ